MIEGLVQVEVVVDHFVVVGCSITLEEATPDHDQKLIAFLQRCQERGLKLNSEKLTLRQTEVAFVGHVASGDGLRVNPAKVKAVLEMLTWDDPVPEQVSTTPVRHDQAPQRPDPKRCCVVLGRRSGLSPETDQGGGNSYTFSSVLQPGR